MLKSAFLSIFSENWGILPILRTIIRAIRTWICWIIHLNYVHKYLQKYRYFIWYTIRVGCIGSGFECSDRGKFGHFFLKRTYNLSYVFNLYMCTCVGQKHINCYFQSRKKCISFEIKQLLSIVYITVNKKTF